MASAPRSNRPLAGERRGAEDLLTSASGRCSTRRRRPRRKRARCLGRASEDGVGSERRQVQLVKATDMWWLTSQRLVSSRRRLSRFSSVPGWSCVFQNQKSFGVQVVVSRWPRQLHRFHYVSYVLSSPLKTPFVSAGALPLGSGARQLRRAQLRTRSRIRTHPCSVPAASSQQAPEPPRQATCRSTPAHATPDTKSQSALCDTHESARKITENGRGTMLARVGSGEMATPYCRQMVHGFCAQARSMGLRSTDEAPRVLARRPVGSTRWRLVAGPTFAEERAPSAARVARWSRVAYGRCGAPRP